MPSKKKPRSVAMSAEEMAKHPRTKSLTFMSTDQLEIARLNRKLARKDREIRELREKLRNSILLDTKDQH